MTNNKTNSLKKNLIVVGVVIILCCLITFFLLEQHRMVEPPSTPDPLIADLRDMISRYENEKIPYINLADQYLRQKKMNKRGFL